MAQDYDKILKENLSSFIPFLVKALIGLTITKEENVDLKLQYTLEREPDFLKIVEDDKQKKYILQVEFQTADEDMRFRLMVYKGILLMKYGLPVKQVVLYIGDKKPLKPNIYSDVDMNFRFHLEIFKEIPHQQFLHSPNPEEVVFAILADFQNEAPEEIIDNILMRLKKLVSGELHLEKYAKQLEVLSKLRNLQTITVQKIALMPIVYDLKTDIRFLQGKDEGKLEGKIEERQNSQMRFCINLLKAKIFPIDQIAQMIEQSTAFVLEVQKFLLQENEVINLLKNKTSINTIIKKTEVSLLFIKAIRHFEQQKKKQN